LYGDLRGIIYFSQYASGGHVLGGQRVAKGWPVAIKMIFLLHHIVHANTKLLHTNNINISLIVGCTWIGMYIETCRRSFFIYLRIYLVSVVMVGKGYIYIHPRLKGILG